MKNYINSCKAEVYQLIHSRVLWALAGIPAGGIILCTLYYYGSKWPDEEKVLGYLKAVAWGLPFITTVIIVLSYRMEQEAGGCQRLLTAPWNIGISHLSKLSVLGAAGFLAVLTGVVGYGMIAILVGNHFYTIPQYIKIAGLLFISDLAWYILQYIICFQFGRNVAVYLGILGILLTALMILRMGDRLWKYISCAWGLRFMSYLEKIEMKSPYSTILQNDMNKGTVMMIIQTVVIALIFLIWSFFWQGSKETGE